MEFTLIINPQKEEHHPDRYKAVLLLDDGLSKAYPHDMELETIFHKVGLMVSAYADNQLEFIYNEKKEATNART